MKKIKDILFEVFMWYVFLIVLLISSAITYLIPQTGITALVGAIGLVTIIRFDKYLKDKRDK